MSRGTYDDASEVTDVYDDDEYQYTRRKVSEHGGHGDDR